MAMMATAPARKRQPGASSSTNAGHNPHAVREALAVLDHAVDHDTREGLAEEARRSSTLIGTPDQIEAVLAHLEGRAPVFGVVS